MGYVIIFGAGNKILTTPKTGHILFHNLIKFLIMMYYYLLNGQKHMNKPILSMTTILLLVAIAVSGIAEERVSVQPPAIWKAREAVQIAMKNSPDSLIAQQRIESARAVMAGAKSQLAPEIGLSSEYSQTNNPMYSFGNILNQGRFNNTIDFNNPGRTDNLNFKIQAQYRFYNGGRDQAALEAAQAGEKGSIVNLAAVHNQLGFEVVRLYLAIIQEQEAVVARESTLGSIKASLAVAKVRYESGTLLKSDLMNLEAQEAASTEDLIQARHTLELTKRSFLNLLGLQKGEVILDPRDTVDQAPPKNLDSTHRPELQILHNAITAAEAEVRKAEGGRYPTMDGFAGYQVDNGSVLTGSGDSWMAGIRVNYTLFDGDRTKAGIAAARSRLSELKEQKHKTELALDLELQKADLEYQQADQRVLVTEKMVDVAKESARLNRIRFQEGVVLSSELIDVEKRLTDALVRQSTARAMRQTAIANLKRAVGLPQFERMAEENQERH
jgi:outer membrane protein